MHFSLIVIKLEKCKRHGSKKTNPSLPITETWRHRFSNPAEDIHLWTSQHGNRLHGWRKSKNQAVSFPLAHASDYSLAEGLWLHDNNIWAWIMVSCKVKKSHLVVLRIWFWWRLSNYDITHNWWENKIPLLERLTTGSFPPPALLEEPSVNLCYALDWGDDAHPCSLILKRTKLQGSQFWTETEQTPKPAANVLHCINAVQIHWCIIFPFTSYQIRNLLEASKETKFTNYCVFYVMLRNAVACRV